MGHSILRAIHKYLPKILVCLLIADALFDTYESLQIIFVKIPELEKQLALHQVVQSQLTDLISGLVIKLFKITLNIIFAIRLAKKHEETAEILDLVIGLALVFARGYINGFIEYLHGEATISEVMAQVAEWFYNLGQKLGISR